MHMWIFHQSLPALSEMVIFSTICMLVKDFFALIAVSTVGIFLTLAQLRSGEKKSDL